MHQVTASSARSWWQRQIREPQVRVALAAGVCTIAQAVIAKNLLEVELDWPAQVVPFWIFIAYLVGDLRTRASELAFIVTIILATAAVLVVYAV